MFKHLSTITRKRIPDKRNYEKGLFLNRAERVQPFSKEITEEISSLFLDRLGNYYDIEKFYSKLGSYLKVDINKIVVTNGAEEAIRYLFDIHIKQNDTIMFPIPTYGMYHVYAQMYNVNTILLPYDQKFNINKQILYDNLEKISVFFLPNPSHIEDIFDRKEIITILNRMNKNNGILVIDETYFGFGSETMLPLINSYKNLYIIRSFSKTFGLPSIRVGCLLSHYDNMKIMSNYRPAYEISYPSLRIAEYFLDNIDLVNAYIQECIKGRDFLIKECLHHNISFNGSHNYLLNIKIGSEDICNRICNDLEDKYIYVGYYKDYIRITIGPINYMKIFMKEFMNLLRKF